MHPLIKEKQVEISALCQRCQVRSLAVFGSATRGDDFKPDASDADFLIEFEWDSPLPPLRAYFGLRDALAYLWGVRQAGEAVAHFVFEKSFDGHVS
ncbi:MAG: nucleotidyltransferase domain-containing protein [Thiothrix sp.]